MNNKVVYLTKPESCRGYPVSNQHDIYNGDDAMTEPILSKTCSKCQETKPLSEFYKNKNYKDGHYYECKLCTKIYADGYRKANPEKTKSWEKTYRENNVDKIKDWHKANYKANTEKINTRNKTYYEANPEKEKIRKQIYHKNNIEKQNVRSREYYRDNREKCKATTKLYAQTEVGKNVNKKKKHKYRALKLKATIEDFNPSEVFERDNYICQLCGIKTRPDFKSQYHPKRPELDHIIPLTKGGEHSKRNTQCLCRHCNITKSNTGKGDQLRLFG
jgi:hypothetical protein